MASGCDGAAAVGCSVEAMAVAPALRVRFGDHVQAERALSALRQRGRRAELEYNERPYDGVGGRGWCIAEQVCVPY